MSNSGGYTGWDLFVGIVGVLTAVPIVSTIFVSQLPSKKLKTLFDILDDTDALLKECIEEGLLRVRHIRLFAAQLQDLRGEARKVHAQVNPGEDLLDDLTHWAEGFTTKIKRICLNVKNLRNRISTTSSHERAARARLDAVHRLRGGGDAVTPTHGDYRESGSDNPVLRMDARICLALILILRKLLSLFSSENPRPTWNELEEPLSCEASDVEPDVLQSEQPAMEPSASRMPATAVSTTTPSQLPALPEVAPAEIMETTHSSATSPSIPRVREQPADTATEPPPPPYQASTVASPPSTYQWKSRSTPYRRTRTLIRFIQRCRKQQMESQAVETGTSVALTDMSAGVQPSSDDNNGWQAAPIEAVHVDTPA